MNLKQNLQKALVGAVLLPLLGAQAKEVSCDQAKKHKNGSQSGYSAKISVHAGKISALLIESFNSTGQEGEAYFCTFNTSHMKLNATWSTVGNTTTITAHDEATGASTITIRQIKDRFIIDPSGLSRGYCGFGAEWPAQLTLSPGHQACTVKP